MWAGRLSIMSICPEGSQSAAVHPSPSEKVHVPTQRFFLRGEIDVASSSQLRTDLDELVRAGSGDLVLDCTDLTFIDSSGVAAIMFTQIALQARGSELQIVNIDGVPARVLEILGLSEALHVKATTPEHPETELTA
jgi:anti-anti-sigma factor